MKSIDSTLNESFLNIPLVGSIAAGEAIEAINSSDSMISIPKSLVSKNSTYFGLKVKGLSMIDEGIFDGDVAIIKKTNSAENGKIAVCFIDGDFTVKRIVKEKGKLFLKAENFEMYECKHEKIIIGVNFISEQILSDNEEDVVKNKDTWVFEKPESSTGPEWTLVST